MKALISVIAIFLCTSCLSQSRISGHITDLLTGKPLYGTKVSIHVLDSVKVFPIRDSFANRFAGKNIRFDSVYKYRSAVLTDTNGYFVFDSLKSDIYRICAFHQTKKSDYGFYEGEGFETFGIQVGCNSKIEQSIRLHVTCEYDSTKNITYCPKCKRNDKVLIIRYGMSPYEEPEEPGYYYNGFCSIPRCHPTKHCMRDGYEF